MDKLRKHRCQFVENMDLIDTVIDKLYAEGIFMKGNCNEIRSISNPDNQVRSLLDIITRKGPNQLETFRRILNETGNTELAELLNTDLRRRQTQKKQNEASEPPQTRHLPTQEQNNVKQYKMLVLQGNSEIELKTNIEYDEKTCSRIIENITTASDSEKHLVIFILGDFDGEAIKENISLHKIPISEICATLKKILPDKKKICVLLHSNDTKKLSSVQESPDDKCLVVALREDRIQELLKEFEINTGDFFLSITKFIKSEEKIWPKPEENGRSSSGMETKAEENPSGASTTQEGNSEEAPMEEGETRSVENLSAISPTQEENIKQYKVLVLQGNVEIKIKKNIEYEPYNCTKIIDKLRTIDCHSKNLVIFILGKFDGKTVEENFSNVKIPISKICATLKVLLPGKKKICILARPKDDTEKLSSVQESPDDKCLVVALSEDRIQELLKEFEINTGDFFLKITNFIKSEERICP